MSVEEISGRFVTSIHKHRKHHCDTCSYFQIDLNQSDMFYKKGLCRLNEQMTFEKSWCKENTGLKNSRKRWLLTTISECPVCGHQTKTIQHIKDRPKPENIQERFIFESTYDNCLEG
jgi:hypothetical protein